MIIDAHAHLGFDVVFDVEQTEDEILMLYKKFGVDGAIIQPFIPGYYIEQNRLIHDRIAMFCNCHKNYFGMASIHPHFNEADYKAEAERCIKKLGFVGIKLTPVAHATHPASKAGRFVFETAMALKVPLMVHTGSGIPFSDPAALLNIIGDYKEIPVVIAHGGTDMFFAQALYLAEKYENVFLEPSWVNILNIQKAVKSIGTSKLMFSTDHAINAPVELAKYRTLLHDSELEQVLYKTAAQVFNLFGKLT